MKSATPFPFPKNKARFSKGWILRVLTGDEEMRLGQRTPLTHREAVSVKSGKYKNRPQWLVSNLTYKGEYNK